MNTIYDSLIAFHGHSCPGLAMGYRMTKAALSFLSQTKAEDEEIVAIVENNACGVDALQFLSGCTFGKGNLIFKDYGKHVYTLYSRQSGKGVRVIFNFRNIPDNIRTDREQLTNWILAASDEKIIKIKEVHIDAPVPARIMDSVECAFCGETVMETRIKNIGNEPTCIPCAVDRGL
jgi:formylmethanofuran dehydrogenase subunit E